MINRWSRQLGSESSQSISEGQRQGREQEVVTRGGREAREDMRCDAGMHASRGRRVCGIPWIGGAHHRNKAALIKPMTALE